MMHGMLILAHLASAQVYAAPVGDPVAHPEVGRVRLDARIGNDRTEERDTRCREKSGCDAVWNRNEISGGLHVAILRGLGIYGELGRETGRIRAADYLGSARVWALGLRGAIPIAPNWWIAADGRFGFGSGEGVRQAETSDPESEKYKIYTASLLGVLGDPAKGADVWFGAQAAWHYEHQVWPLGQAASEIVLDVPLQPKDPVSGVIGGALYSEPLGLPWRTSIRMNVGIEGRVGQSTGVSGWVGAAF